MPRDMHYHVVPISRRGEGLTVTELRLTLTKQIDAGNSENALQVLFIIITITISIAA